MEASGSTRRTLLLLLLLVTIVGSWALAMRARSLEEGIEAFLAAEQVRAVGVRRKELWDSKKYDETGFERMAPPRQGEWLARFPEQGQTYTEYFFRTKNRTPAPRAPIALRPLGPLSPRARGAAASVKRFCEAFFGVEVRLLDEAPLPEVALVADRGQYDVTPLLAHLKKERGKEAELAHAALCDRDLCWIGQLDNFCFGGASVPDGVSVYSLHRLGQGVVPEPLYRKRAFQLVAHELGHALGMAHCIFYKCLMNGTASLEESDRSPCHLCPVCEKKLRWYLGLERRSRELALANVFREEGIEDEAKWAEAHAER